MEQTVHVARVDLTMTFHITFSAVRLTIRYGKRPLAVGSGFLYRRNNKHNLVTAWHNLAGRDSLTLKVLHKQGALPNNIIVDMPQVCRFPGRDLMFVRRPVRFDIDDGTKTSYRVHTQSWPRVDVAVIPFDPGSDIQHEVYLSTGATEEFIQPLAYHQWDGTVFDIVSLNGDEIPGSLLEPFITPDQIVHTVGDNLFILGFPAGIFDHSVAPIWKRGTIATEPSLGWNRQEQFLVDCASRKGMSGAVALYYDKFGHVPVHPGSDISIGQPLCIIHGVYVGRLDDSEFEAQVGMVWKKKVIDEIIDGGRPGIPTKDIECSVDDVVAKVEELWSEDVDPEIYLQEMPPLYSLSNHIVGQLDGRANPYFVSEKLKEFAKRKKESAGGK